MAGTGSFSLILLVWNDNLSLEDSDTAVAAESLVLIAGTRHPAVRLVLSSLAVDVITTPTLISGLDAREFAKLAVASVLASVGA